MKKTSLIYFVLFFLITTFAFACKKDEPQQEDIFAESVWIGKIKEYNLRGDGIHYYSLRFGRNKTYYFGACDAAGVVVRKISEGTYDLSPYPYIDLNSTSSGAKRFRYNLDTEDIWAMGYNVNLKKQ